jgi:hypothetical protein
LATIGQSIPEIEEVLQLSEPRSLAPTVESPGFKLVEEDDVAFSLGLCREIQRIYVSYHDGDLTPTEGVRDGLALSLEMLTVLRATVTEGMPAMRLEVAAAQAREIVGVLFGIANADRSLIMSQAKRKLNHLGASEPNRSLPKAARPPAATAVSPRGRQSIFARLASRRRRRLAALDYSL